MSVRISEEQALAFRARRSFLIDGAKTPVDASRAIVGAQAQQEGTALFGLSQRTTSRPTAVELAGMLHGADPSLVRTWGQRGTVHIYDPEDWPTVHQAMKLWPQTGRTGKLVTDKELAPARSVMLKAGGPFHREALEPLAPEYLIKQMEERIPDHNRHQARTYAASRLIWQLANQGELCFAHKEGAKQLHVARRFYFPDLSFNNADPRAAAVALVDRYLATYAPATAVDIGHFFGARMGEVRSWLDDLELVEVICGDRPGLVARAQDQKALKTPPPKTWPLRILPTWDSHLMTHKDKTWVVPKDEHKKVWRSSAVVAASVLFRGRVVASWTQKSTKKLCRLRVQPLSGYKSSMKAALTKEAQAYATHTGREQAEVTLEAR